MAAARGGFLLIWLLASGSSWAGQHVISVRGETLELNGRPIKLIGLRCSNALISGEKSDELIGQLDIFREYGVNAISVYLMGSRFGNIKGYRSDQRAMVVLVGCLYWGDSTAKASLDGWKQADADRAVANTVRWLAERDYRNVFVDPDNEGMAVRARNWDLTSMIRAAHAVDPTMVMALT